MRKGMHRLNSMQPRILSILAHPSRKSFSDDLHRAYLEGASRSAEVEELVLGDLDFDLVLRGPSHALEPDLQRAQERIAAADHVAWFFPTWWVATPALLKGFLDRTFVSGWAFRFEKGRSLPVPLLKGRSGRVVTTMDSPRWWYRFRHRRSVHVSLIQGTLRFVGFDGVRHATFYDVRSMSTAQRDKARARMHDAGENDARRLRRRVC